MASQTDLDGFLRDDDDNLTNRIINWLGKPDRKPPLRVNVRWRDVSASTARRLHEDPIVIDPPDPRGAANLIDTIEKIVTDAIGQTPIGTIRVTGYDTGESSRSSLDMSRQITAPEGGAFGEPNLALLRGLYSTERQLNHHLSSELRQALHSSTALNGVLAQALASSATIRTAASAASDTTGLGPLLALGSIIVFAPHIKQAMGLHPEAPLSEVIRAARAGIADALAGKAGGTPELVIPEHAREERAPLRIEAPPADGAAPVDDVAAFLRDLVARLEADPAFRARAMAAAMASEPIRADAMAAYMAPPVPPDPPPAPASAPRDTSEPG